MPGDFGPYSVPSASFNYFFLIELLLMYFFLLGCDAYDAYVCYADEDSSIAGEIVQRLESPRIGLKLLKRGRDMLAECSNFELIKNKYETFV